MSEEHDALSGIFSPAEQAIGQDAYQSQIKHQDAHSNYTIASSKVQEAYAQAIKAVTGTVALYGLVLLPSVTIKGIRWAVKK